ncbi:DUF402 domain-containing protein [Agromyces italicus]|uniref:DUF402 domain-containing protein n=1 Tax=Agromyces italicus TaxID=279572 RepID=UPI0003B5B1F2|nr:DUF402 domain-containing protein [Agromyces italicus]
MDRPATPLLHPGDAVRVRALKWGGAPHWQFDGLWLGDDEHGSWVGFPVGTRFVRPGNEFTATWHSVSLFPHAGWAAGFNSGHPRGLGTYVDLATTPEWRADATGATVSYVDLDLDVVEREGVPAFIEDEDEFAEHAADFGYPADLIRRVRSDAERVLGAVRNREPPFDGATAARWLARLAGLAARAARDPAG